MMKTIYYFGMVLMLISIVSCSDSEPDKADSNSKEQKDTDTLTLDTAKAIVETKSWEITPNGIDLMEFGFESGKLGDDYRVEYVTDTIMEEGEAYFEDKALIYYGEELLLELITGGSGPDAAVTEVIIHSDKFKTAEGIGVGSTKEDFIKAYPGNTLWYTYVGDFVTFDTDAYPNMQFHLDMKDYKQDVVIDSDMMMLNPSDFKKGARIKSIRIF